MSDPTPTPEEATVTPVATKPEAGLARTALIVAIVAGVCAIVPGLSFVAFIPAIGATILGIVALVRKVPGRGKALTGVIVGPIALVLSIVVSVALVLVLVAAQRVEPQSSSPAPSETPTGSAAHEGQPLQPDDDSYEVLVKGKGDTTLAVDTVDGIDLPMAISFTHEASGPFKVTTLDANGVESEVLVDTVGSYSGTVIANVYRDTHPASFSIVADGDWSYTVRTIYALPEFTAKSTWGTGDMVLIYNGDATTATFTHEGPGAFTVWTYGDQPLQVIDTSGTYSDDSPLRAGPELISIKTEGVWSIELK